MVTEDEQSVKESAPAAPESPPPAEPHPEDRQGEPPAEADPEVPQAEVPVEPPEQEPPAEEEIELVRPGMHWYVLRVASNKEDQVREALERKVRIELLEERVGRILVPTQRERRVRGGSSRVYQRKLYPGYVFVEMATDEDGRIPESVWFVIKETTGVGDFIGSGGKPSPMPSHDVEKMLAAAVQREESPTLANLAFKKGDRVKVNEGPFENFEGVVDEINMHKGTVRVIVTIFGRATPIEIEYWQVEQV